MQTRKRSRNPGKSIKKACYICQNLKILNFSVSYTEKDRSNATKVIFSNISGDKGIKYDIKSYLFQGYISFNLNTAHIYAKKNNALYYNKNCQL